MPQTRKAKPRRRLDSAAARELILDATEKQMVAAGPSGIRLQEVAAEAGVSHPTVLHHFGSREQLVKAVIQRSLRAINVTLIDAIQRSSGDEKQLEAMIESVAEALEKSGHGRVIMWLALEGHKIDGADVSLTDVVDATHALRLTRQKPGSPPPSREDTAQTVALATLALVSGCVIGPMILENSGLGSERANQTKFRTWLARLLLGHLDG